MTSASPPVPNAVQHLPDYVQAGVRAGTPCEKVVSDFRQRRISQGKAARFRLMKFKPSTTSANANPVHP